MFTFIGKSLLSAIIVSLFCWTCFGGMSGMSAMAMDDEMTSTTIQCADSLCGVSSTTMPMTANCATQCLTKATEGSVSTASFEGTPTVLAGERILLNEWLGIEVIEKTQSTFVSHHQRMFVVQRE